jgi:hypothetical protein
MIAHGQAEDQHSFNVCHLRSVMLDHTLFVMLGLDPSISRRPPVLENRV